MPTSDKELSLSYSMLSTALRCNRLYKHLYVDKLTPEEPPSLSLHFGTALHMAINAILEGGGGQAGVAVFMAYWGSVRGLPFRNERYDWPEYGEMGSVFIERFTRLYAKRLEPQLMERRLYVKSPSYDTGLRLTFEGTPDFFGDLDGVPTLLDFKTSGTRYDNDKHATADQMRLYAYMVQQGLKVEVKQIAYLVFVKSVKTPSIQLQVAPLDQAELLARIKNMEVQADQLTYKGAYPQNFGACLDFGRKCPFWDKCHGKKEQEDA